MSSEIVLANRYAHALHEIAVANNKQEDLLDELRKLQKVFKSVEHLDQILSSPVLTKEQKSKMLTEAVDSNRTSELTANFIKVLAENDRLYLFGQVVNAFQTISDEAHNMVRGTVRSSHSMSMDERQSLESKISSVTGKRAILDYREDKELIGGVVADVASFTFDGSIETQLKILKEEIKRSTH